MPINKKVYCQEELMSLIRKDDAMAFNAFYDTYSAVLYCAISKSNSDRKICEIIFQKVLIKIWQEISTFDSSKQRLLAWMLQTARDVASENIQSQKLNTNSQIQTSTNIVFDSKEVLTLIYSKGYSINKAAEVLDISIEELKMKLKTEFDQLRS